MNPAKVVAKFNEVLREFLGEDYERVSRKARELSKHPLFVLKEMGWDWERQKVMLKEVGKRLGYEVSFSEGSSVSFTEVNGILAKGSDGNTYSFLPVEGAVVIPVWEFERLAREARARASLVEEENFEESFFRSLVSELLRLEASDLHVHPKGSVYHFFARVKKDFIHLREFMLPADRGRSFVRYLKSLASSHTKGLFKADVSGKVQDARIKLEDFGIVLRLSFAPDPSLEHEVVVARILRTFGKSRNLYELGYLEDDVRILLDVLTRRRGIVCVQGVTNSGKTTLVTSLLSLVRDKKVITVEDPVEYLIENPNVVQYQVIETPLEDLRATFLDYARAIKRQDPDIVFIGEWRNDPRLTKTLEELVQAGQLVFTTLHIPSAFVYFEALESMYGVPWELSVRTLILSFNQTLVKKVCRNCGKKLKGGEAFKLFLKSGRISERFFDYFFYSNRKEFKEVLFESEVWVAGEGCESCRGGFSGVTPVYEYLYPTVEFLEWIRKEKPTAYEVEKEGRKEGLAKNKLDVVLKKLNEIPFDSLLELR